MPEIRMANGPLKGQAFEISDKAVTLGRDDSCTIQIMDKGASRKHAELFKIGEMCFIRDFKSRNGTLLNDDKIEEEMLRDGDTIKIGGTIIDFFSVSTNDSSSSVEFFDEEDSSANLELDLEDLTDLNASQGDGADMFRLRSLYRLGRIIDDATSEKSLIDATLPLITEHFNSEMTYLFTRNSETEVISPIGSDVKRGKEKEMISRSIIKRAIVDKMAILTSDATRDGRFNSQESIMTHNIRSVICVPLSVSGKINGVIYLASNTPTVTFREEDLELAAAMADQVGLAITNFRYRSHLRGDLMSTIGTLVSAIEESAPEIKGRARDVADYALHIAENLNIDEEAQQTVVLASLLHNIGILDIASKELFIKDTSSLDLEQRIEIEKAKIKATLTIIASMKCYDSIQATIRFMYERGDMSGPNHLERYEIPETAKIVGIAIEFEEQLRIRGNANKKLILQDFESKIDLLYDKRIALALIAQEV